MNGYTTLIQISNVAIIISSSDGAMSVGAFELPFPDLTSLTE